MKYIQLKMRRRIGKKVIITWMGLVFLFLFVFPRSARGEVKVLNTARCIFGSVVTAARKVGIKVKMNGNCAGLNKGIEAVNQGTVDVGTLSRNLTPEEIEKGLLSIPLTFDGMAALVNRENPVDNLTYTQILEIMAGRVKNWKAFGGPDKKIMIICHSCGASEKDYIRQILAEEGIIPDEAYLTKATLSSDIADNVIIKLKRYNTAIAFVPPIFYSKEVKIVTVNGQLPTRDNVLSGKYPLRRPLNLVTMGPPTGDAKKFVSFLTGLKGMALIEENLTMEWFKDRF